MFVSVSRNKVANRGDYVSVFPLLPSEHNEIGMVMELDNLMALDNLSSRRC